MIRAAFSQLLNLILGLGNYPLHIELLLYCEEWSWASVSLSSIQRLIGWAAAEEGGDARLQSSFCTCCTPLNSCAQQLNSTGGLWIPFSPVLSHGMDIITFNGTLPYPQINFFDVAGTMGIDDGKWWREVATSTDCLSRSEWSFTSFNLGQWTSTRLLREQLLCTSGHLADTIIINLTWIRR